MTYETNTIYVSIGKELTKEHIKLSQKIPKSSILVHIALPGFNWNKTYSKKIMIIDARLGDREASAIIAQYMLDNKLNRMCGYYHSEAEKEWLHDKFIPQCRSLFWISLATSMTFAPKYVLNSIKNLKYIRKSPNVSEFKDKASGLPAIVVGSGPSLNKNIKVLKELQGNAIIIASGSAIGALHYAGIESDILVASDAGDYDDLDNVVNGNTILCSALELQPKINANHIGRKMFFYSRPEWTMSWCKQHIPDPSYLQQNVSCSTAAFNLAFMMGCNPIIFVGQDLAFNDDEHHAEGSKANDYLRRKERQVKVEGYEEGTFVDTVPELKDVASYLSSAKAIAPNVRMINATEGGARIKNFEQIKLKDIGLNTKIDKTFLDVPYQKFVTKSSDESFQTFINRKVEQLKEARKRTYDASIVCADDWFKFIEAEKKSPIYPMIKQGAQYGTLYIYFQKIDGAKSEIVDGESVKMKGLLLYIIDELIKELSSPQW